MAGHRKLPDFGGVSGSAAMAIGLDAVALHDIGVSIGSKQGTHLSVEGDVGYIPLVAGKAIRKSDLRLGITTVDLARLGKQFHYQWPDLGRAELAGDIELRGSELRLENARFIAGHPDRPMLKADGSLATELNKGSTLDFGFDAAVSGLVAAVSDIKPAYLGHVRGRTRISDRDGSWGIDTISLVSRDTDLYRLDINGSYGDLANHDRGDLKLDIAVDDMAALGRATGMKLPKTGSFRTGGTLQANRAKFSYRGNAALGHSSATTRLDGVLRNGKLQLSGKLSLPVLHLDDVGLAGKGRVTAAKDNRPLPGMAATYSAGNR